MESQFPVCGLCLETVLNHVVDRTGQKSLSTTTNPCSMMPCGHLIHDSCFSKLIAQGSVNEGVRVDAIACPVCSRQCISTARIAYRLTITEATLNSREYFLKKAGTNESTQTDDQDGPPAAKKLKDDDHKAGPSENPTIQPTATPKK